MHARRRHSGVFSFEEPRDKLVTATTARAAWTRTRRPSLRFGMVALLAGCASLAWAQAGTATNSQTMEARFQSAVAAYHAGNLSEASRLLESMLPQAQKSFEVHELLGLVDAAEHKNSAATEQLKVAAELKPESPPAHTNLGTSLLRGGKPEQALKEFQSALALAPTDYEANHNLAEFYLQSKDLARALPRLEQAQRTRPDAYDNGYDLALAYLMVGRTGEARQTLQSLVAIRDAGELHNLLGQVDERDGKYLEAANEFAAAAHMDPSEDNLFVWGSELLLHRTYEPAIAVFQQATQRYPDSPRLAIGLGMALYSHGQYEESIASLLRASDLNPHDARCYLFLSKAYLSSQKQAEDVIARFKRYAELEPQNGLAQYYYAVSLWKGRRLEDSTVDFAAVEALLQKAVALDGSLAEAHLQLGILYSDQHAYEKSLPEYRQALALAPELPDAHYRLGQYYVHAGDKEHAQQEFAVYQKLQAAHQAAVDKERAEVQQFVVASQSGGAGRPATVPAESSKP